MSELTELYLEMARCERCALAKTRLKVVPGEGDEKADIFFIGEAPGWHENQQGRPFVGPAGQFLDDLLASINLKRADVYIGNVVKCRPPANRDPLPAEIEACSAFLDRQLRLIEPKVIVTLGRYSMARFFPGESISRIHGVARKRGDLAYFPMYHPAAALHQPSLRKILEADVLKLPEIIAKAVNVPEVREQPEVKQLSMF
ncbi:MAG: uracil-DNA glycosylase [Chloroflexi bacterium]|nr:uracil-DNA glycosylase [Chloroflexota bacterium]